jgi:serine/threonine-protein kinase RsbT
MTFNKRLRSIRSETDITVALSKLRADMQTISLSDYDMTRVMTATSELVRNILKYAGHGSLIYAQSADGIRQGIEVIVEDNGPGIDDIEKAMSDNYSLSGTLGMGLPGVRRLTDEFEMKSELGIGTTVMFKVWGS